MRYQEKKFHAGKKREEKYECEARVPHAAEQSEAQCGDHQQPSNIAVVIIPIVVAITLIVAVISDNGGSHKYQ